MVKKHDPSKGGALQMGFFMPDCDWKPTSVPNLPSWANAKRIGFDCETRDPDLKQLGPGPRRDGYVTGYSFAIEDGPSHYIPLRHEGGGNLPIQEALAYLRYQMANFKGEYVGANISYDIDYAVTDDLVFHPDAMFRDVQIADPLIYELHFNFSLLEIGKRWGLQAKDESILIEAAKAHGVDPKSGMWRLHSKFVGGYAEQDARSPLEIYARQREKIEALNLWQIFDIESKVLPVLVKMRQRGVKIDLNKLTDIENWALAQETEALRFIKDKTGVDIGVGNVWKAGALAPALENIGVRLQKTTQGAPQIDAALLDSINDPVAAAIKRSRKTNKIRTTFAASMRTHMVGDRIHCTFNQIARENEAGEQKGVRYGRLSATNPNMQQQPNPDRDPDIAGEWRKIFIPDEGAIWGCNDYSQQEPRWTTHYAALMELPRADEVAARYRENPHTDNHDMMTRLIHGDTAVDAMGKAEYKQARTPAKDIFLGVCYGEGGPKLCKELGKPTRWAVRQYRGDMEYYETRHEAWERKADLGRGYIQEVAGIEGQAILDDFDREVPYVRQLAKAASAQAEKNGFIRTILGRRLHFTQRENGQYDWTHKALNRIIQGSAADQTKAALIEMDQAGVYLQLQVHDETDGSFGTVEEAHKAGDIMRDCIFNYTQPLVPFKVDTECGPSWGEIK